MNSYVVLKKNCFVNGKYSIVPIRYEDKLKIMEWRNEQMYHLRQDKPITVSDQENYFSNVIKESFDHKEPNQILFSYLEDDICIGYGGLVHINWKDKNAEISFILKTKLEKKNFKSNWSIFLNLLEVVAFEELKFNKIYTYAYDVRPQLSQALVELNYSKEATLKDHVKIGNVYRNIIIHSKFNKTKY